MIFIEVSTAKSIKYPYEKLRSAHGTPPTLFHLYSYWYSTGPLIRNKPGAYYLACPRLSVLFRRKCEFYTSFSVTATDFLIFPDKSQPVFLIAAPCLLLGVLYQTHTRRYYCVFVLKRLKRGTQLPTPQFHTSTRIPLGPDPTWPPAPTG